MAKIKWDAPTDRTFTSGISRAVLFPAYSAPVVWNGLTSVEEVIASAETKAYYLDGRKIHQAAPTRVYQALLKTFTVPEAFERCLGMIDVVPGVVLTKQDRSIFNLTYETSMGDSRRQIHLVRNATATPQSKTYSTIRKQTQIVTHNFLIDAVPDITQSNALPTAHLIIDSSKMPDYIFTGVENLIYGAEGRTPTFPNQSFLENLVANPLVEPLYDPI